MDFLPRRFGAPRETALQIGQIALAALGGALFAWLNIPAGWLSGSLVAVAVLVVFRKARAMPPALSDLAMMMAGISLGASATPEAIAALGRYPASLAILLVAVVAVTFGSAEYLRRRPHWTHEEALFASVPGALTVVLAVAADRRARLGPIVVIQMFRLLALMLVLPSVITMVEHATGSGGGSALGGAPMGYPALLVLLAIGAGIGLLFRRLDVPAPMLFGTMMASVAGHASGTVSGGLPPVMFIATLVLVGTFVAVRMRNLTAAQVRAAMPEAFVAFVIGSVIAALFAGLVTLIVGIRFDIAYLAFAPGGLEAMIVLAIALGLDPLYVGTHHLVRMMAISIALPLAMRWRDRKHGDDF